MAEKISQGEETSQYYNTNDLLSMISKMKVHRFTKITAIVEDTEGTRYKKQLTRVHRLK